MTTNIRYAIEYTNHIEVYYFSGKHRKVNKGNVPSSVVNFMNTAKTIHRYGNEKQYATYSNRTF